MTWSELYTVVSPELAKVEVELARIIDASYGPAIDVCRGVITAPGKRLRSTLLLLSAGMIGPIESTSIRLAAVVELIHDATLIHDDVIDQSDKRRGRPSANALWGNSAAVLAGDWLYMQAFRVALDERGFDYLLTLIQTTQQILEGELMQLRMLGRIDLSEAELLQIADRKTASLFSGCAKLGGLASRVGGGVSDRLSAIGWNLGMAFQLVDDILDVISSQATLGKPTGQDLREGKLTLPLYYGLRSANATEISRVRRGFSERGLILAEQQEILRIVERGDGVPRTLKRAEQYVDSAISLLQEFDQSAYRDALVTLGALILEHAK
jgi:octaprenyl-diphosphate synthase